MRFHNKVVIITGAAGGIGRAAARLFAQEGARLALVDLDTEQLEAIRRELNLDIGRCLIKAADVTDEKAVADYTAKALQTFGVIDVVFNNAGIVGEANKVPDFSAQSMQQVLQVNVMGVFYGMKYALRAMQPRGQGVIINTGSISGVRGMPDTIAYCASKHAIMGMTRCAAAENAETGIRVCAVCPSPVSTSMMTGIEDSMAGMSCESREGVHRRLLGSIPMGRYARPDEVAKAVLFLASEDSSFISGSAIFVDGCFTA